MHEPTMSERLFSASVSALELYGVYLGKRLHLYEHLRQRGPLTPGELSDEAGIAPRYAREWLEQQAVAGFLGVDDPTKDPAARRFSLPPEHVGALCDPDDPGHVAPLAEMIVGVGGALPSVVEAYRRGTGVPYARYGSDFVIGQGGVNRPAFAHDLVERWIPALDDVHARLLAGEKVRIVEIGCGVGWAAIALARRFPRAEIVGVDPDRESIGRAIANAAEAGVKVRFECVDAADLRGAFDLALVLEALHDMSRPVDVLASARASLVDGGSVLVVDERAAEQFTVPGDERERIFYGWSITHCLPVAMVEQPSEAIGTAIRPDTVHDCARRAGFARCDILPVEHDLFRLYRMR